MTQITSLITAPASTGFFSDDQEAVRQGAVHDGFAYVGNPVTRGFERIRQPGEALAVLLTLEDGQVAHGDCASVQYAGVGGRAQVFTTTLGQTQVEQLAPTLVGAPTASFRDLDQRIATAHPDLHPAVQYGVSQALLHAAALASHRTIAEQVRHEYGIEPPLRRIPVFAQTGEQRHEHVDKMILRRLDVLPHGLLNSVDLIGLDGAALREYVAWVAGRVRDLGGSDYEPVLHFDVYGTLGLITDNDLVRVADHIAALSELTLGLRLRVEGPVDLGGREAQIDGLGTIRDRLRQVGSAVEIVADEWCNDLDDVRAFVAAGAVDMIQVKTPDLGSVASTIEALLHCRRNSVGAYSGGTCNETDRSAQVSTQVAMACGADQTLAKPGMGVDEGFMIVSNEMARVLALSGRPGASAAAAPR
jgi:methylaspartate ammonia-lyase